MKMVAYLLVLTAFTIAYDLSGSALAEDKIEACIAPGILKSDTRLDPRCVYAGPIRIEASHVTLDCAGSKIDARNSRNGVLVFGPSISDVTIKNCIVDGARNEGIFVRPPINAQEMANLPLEERFKISPRSIRIINSTSINSGTAGIYVGNYAQDTLIENSMIKNSGSVGVYLDASSVRSTVNGSTISNNGYGDPLGRREKKGRREGVAIDSSAYNTLTNNVFESNAIGGVYIYKNCWERHNDPKQVKRWQSASFNVMRNNHFNEKIGVWIASRQAKNLKNMNCGDPPLAPGYFRDYADHNTVELNRFEGGEVGVNIQDDFAIVKGNRFDGQLKSCVILGSSLRDELLKLPIVNTVLADNSCQTKTGEAYITAGSSRYSQCSENTYNGLAYECRP